MTDSNNTHNNSFIPVLFLLVSAIVIIATFYEGAKETVASTDASQTESVAQSDQHDTDKAHSIQDIANLDTTPDNTAVEHNAEQTSPIENTLTLETTVETTTETKAAEIKVAQVDTTIVTEGNGANGSAGDEIVKTNTQHKESNNEESAVTSTSENAETKNKTAASESKEANLDAPLNVAQNTVSNTAETHPNATQHSPMSAHPTNMSAAPTTNQYTQRYAAGYSPRYVPFSPRQGYQNMMAQPPKAYNTSRQHPAQPQISMAQHKEASMAYQAKMEQRRQEMMKAMQAQRLAHNARIQTQLKNQAKFLAEMRQMQQMAFQRAEENRRRTMQKIQEINQRYKQLQNQVNTLDAEPKTTPSSDTGA